MKRPTSNEARGQGRALLALAALSALLGVLPVTGCSGGCPVLESCDIRRSACQAHTADVATCLSGDSTVRPALVVVDAQLYVDEQIAGGMEAETDDQRDLRRGLALLNLMPAQPDTTELVRDYWATVSAFYAGREHARATPLGIPADRRLGARAGSQHGD